ncbi:aromatic amino acid lyase, partial [Geminicoccus flavidas]|uniref:aromatic amino acid lyase n=1 Tax=Geminicoccus flavidas TaxID=2506407 RepID=UPI0013571AA7
MPELVPGRVVLSELMAWAGTPGLELVLDESFRPKIAAAEQVVARAAAADAPTYGVNTGFGRLAHTRISPAQVEELQKRLVLSHMCGVGRPLDDVVVRLVLILKAASLAHGHSGVRPATVDALLNLLRHDALPVVPAKGSVGASGDLAPLAHLSGALIGEGEIRLAGERLPAREALARIGAAPLVLGPKEGLALLNGTQVSTALAIHGWWQAQLLLDTALIAGALTVDAAKGSDTPFDARIHRLRNQTGQGIMAAKLAGLLQGSEIRESHRYGDDRVQDPYCLRCQPQVMGACWDLLSDAAGILEREANGVSDNPLVFPEDGEILSGGNFHAEPVALAA